MTVKARKAGEATAEAPAAAARPAYEGPRSPVRVMQIVEALAEAPQGISLALLARQLDLPKTSLLNHLRVMVGSGHVALKDSVYVLGPAAVRLGLIIFAGSGALAAIGPITRELAATSGETSLCGMIDQDAGEVIYVEMHEGWQHIRYSPPRGTRRPLYCSGMGRALLAWQDEPFLHRYVDGTKFESLNGNTVTSPAKLRKIFEQIRADGYAVTMGERIADLGAIASPIVDRQGRVQYSIGVVLPVTRIGPSRERMAELVKAAAQRASWALGA